MTIARPTTFALTIWAIIHRLRLHIVRKLYKNPNVNSQEKENIAAYLRQARQSKGWTLQEAANRCGLSRNGYTAIENGERNRITAEVLNKIANGFGVSITTLANAPASQDDLIAMMDRYLAKEERDCLDRLAKIRSMRDMLKRFSI